MASNPRPAWRRLPVAGTNQIRSSVLFFTLKRHRDGLHLQFTDLVHVWIASNTSREELIEEALRRRCSIDPSEDDEQYEVLLSKLEEAISGRDGASVRLVQDKQASAPMRFEIETSIPLPRPLGMLEWTFHMVRQGPSAFMQDVVMPAFCVIDVSRRREQDLQRKIKEKDHVIGRLVDKIEGSGIDLSMVFPGFAGARKGLNARQAAEVVPGIKAFRVEDWGGDLKDGDDGGLKEIVDALKDPETGKVAWSAPMALAKEPKCEQSGDRKYNLVTGMKDEQRGPPHQSTADDDDVSGSSEASPRNAKAPRRSSSSVPSPAHSGNNESSGDQPKPKLGALGGMKGKSVALTRQESLSPSPERPTRPLRKLSSASSDTAAESESERAVARGAISPSKKKPISKMGIIGGVKAQRSTQEKTKSPKPSAEPGQKMPSRGKSKLGAIGGKTSKATSPPPRVDDSVKSPTSCPPPGISSKQGPATEPDEGQDRVVTPVKTEEPITEAEKANQKRIELKRQLDQGAGKKKKRKF